MSILGDTLEDADSADDLLHCDPGAVRTKIDDMLRVGRTISALADGMRDLDNRDHWNGPAADAFRAFYAPHPAAWREIGNALITAGTALDTYCETLLWARQQMTTAFWRYQVGADLSADAATRYTQHVKQYNTAVEDFNSGDSTVDPGKPPMFVDPGAAERADAERLWSEARSKLKEAADLANITIGECRDAAPPKPSTMTQIGHGLGTIAHNFGDQVKGFVTAVGSDADDVLHLGQVLDPRQPYNLTHPATYLQNQHALLDALGSAVSHPVRTLKDAVSWDDFADGRIGAGLGHTLPGVLLGAGLGRLGTTAGRTLAAGAARGTEHGVEHSVTREIEHGLQGSVTRSVEHGPSGVAPAPVDNTGTIGDLGGWGSFGPGAVADHAAANTVHDAGAGLDSLEQRIHQLSQIGRGGDTTPAMAPGPDAGPGTHAAPEVRGTHTEPPRRPAPTDLHARWYKAVEKYADEHGLTFPEAREATAHQRLGQDGEFHPPEGYGGHTPVWEGARAREAEMLERKSEKQIERTMQRYRRGT